MSDTKLYGLCELARELGLPESTTRYYRDVFSPFVPSVGAGRKRRYPVEALAALRFIAEAFAAGQTRDEIMATLTKGAAPKPDADWTEPAPASFTRTQTTDSMMSSHIESEREQRELMWQMIRELSRFGDAIERQHYILSELVDHVFHNADRQLPAAGDENELDTVIDAEVVLEPEEYPGGDSANLTPTTSQSDVEALRKALETERELVNRLRQSKLDLERRTASAEEKLQQKHEQEPGLLRRLFERDRGR